MSVEHRLGRLERALPRPRRMPAHVTEEPIRTVCLRALTYAYRAPADTDEGPALHDATWHVLELVHGAEAARQFGHDRRPTWHELLTMPKRQRDAACAALSKLPTWPAEGEPQ